MHLLILSTVRILYRWMNNLLNHISSLGNRIGKVNEAFNNIFSEKIADDFNIPQAFAVFFEMLKSDILPADKLATALEFDKVFGLKLNEAIQKKIEVPVEVKKFVEEREIARKEKNWAKSDELRDKIKNLGYEVKDSPAGSKVHKI